MFSTADLLMESRLTAGPQGNQSLTINLNHAVTRLLTENDRVAGVVAYDLIANRERTYRAKVVVLAAGTIESAKIALLSGLQDPNGKIGKGITDHPIFFTHFVYRLTRPFSRRWRIVRCCRSIGRRESRRIPTTWCWSWGRTSTRAATWTTIF